MKNKKNQKPILQRLKHYNAISNFAKKYIFRTFWLYILGLSLLVFASFWRLLTFYFYQDDYQFLWYAFYHPLNFLITFRHPGTPLEAIIFHSLFGLHPLPWQLLGIFYKICAAYLSGVFLYKITKSKLVGFLTAIFFAVSYEGMYVMYSFNYHVAALITIPILLSLIYFVKMLQEGKQNVWKFILFLFLAIALDPARAMAILFIIPFLLLLFPKSKNYVFVKRFITKFFIILAIIGTPLFLFWYVVVSRGAGSQFEVFLRGMVTNPRYMITKTKDIGNLFASMINIFTDPVYGLASISPKYEFAVYNQAFGLGGVILIIGSIVSFIYFLRKKSHTLGIISFLIFWVYIFFIPNWLAEPRAPMAAINHYLFISSVGSLGLIAYLFSFLKKKWILVLLSVAFLVVSIYKSNAILAEQIPYRSPQLIQQAWNTILQSVPKKTEANDIFLFTGNTYWAGYSFQSFGAYHFLLSKKDGNALDLPLFTVDKGLVMAALCMPSLTTLNQQIPLVHVYAWDVKAPGILVDTTKEERKKFFTQMLQTGCHLEKKHLE